MKELQAGIFRIAFNERSMSHFQRSSLEKDYDKVIVADNCEDQKILEVRIESPSSIKKVALVTFTYTQPDNFAVTTDNKVFMVFQDLF